jgi:hypothetical protein
MELPISNTYTNFSCHHLCCFTVVSLFVLDKSMAYNRCLQHPCFKNLCKIAQASKNSNSNAQHFLSDLLTHSWFHSMLFALPHYQFPYIVMNRCLYLILAVGSPRSLKEGWFLDEDTKGDTSISRHVSDNRVVIRTPNNTRVFNEVGLCVQKGTYHDSRWIVS